MKKPNIIIVPNMEHVSVPMNKLSMHNRGIRVNPNILKQGIRIATKGEVQAHEGLCVGDRRYTKVNGTGEVILGPDEFNRYYVDMDRGNPKCWILRQDFITEGA